MQMPGLDSDGLGARATGADQSKNCCRNQPSAASPPLVHKSSTVRFILDSQADSADISQEQASHDDTSIAEVQIASETSYPNDLPSLSGSRSVSSLSNAGSLKSALKQTLSSASSASGVSFALEGNDDDDDSAENAAKGQGTGLVKEGSQSFPTWLTER